MSITTAPTTSYANSNSSSKTVAQTEKEKHFAKIKTRSYEKTVCQERNGQVWPKLVIFKFLDQLESKTDQTC